MVPHALRVFPLLLTTVLCLLTACGDPRPIAPRVSARTDALAEAVAANIARSAGDANGGGKPLERIVEIDHCRLAAEAGEEMPPARVIIFSDPVLETAMVAETPLAAFDLPLRILPYEPIDGRSAVLLRNGFETLESRHGVSPLLAADYEAAMAVALGGVDPAETALARPSPSTDPGIVTIESAYGFDETVARVEQAIASQGDTVGFGTVDFAARAAAHGVEIRPLRLMLFGGPAPGGKAMREAPELGLDAFCQKLVVSEGDDGIVRVSFNDLLVLADRIGVGPSLPLRVISLRLARTFGEAVAP